MCLYQNRCANYRFMLRGARCLDHSLTPAFARVTWTQQNSPACNGHDSKRQMFGDFAQDVCLIYGHQEGGCYLFPGTTSHTSL